MTVGGARRSLQISKDVPQRRKDVGGSFISSSRRAKRNASEKQKTHATLHLLKSSLRSRQVGFIFSMGKTFFSLRQRFNFFAGDCIGNVPESLKVNKFMGLVFLGKTFYLVYLVFGSTPPQEACDPGIQDPGFAGHDVHVIDHCGGNCVTSLENIPTNRCHPERRDDRVCRPEVEGSLFVC